MHRPSKRTLESDYSFGGLVNSYSKVFFNDFKYLSDSRMRWREDVDSIVVAGEYKALHILTHPIWHTDVGMKTHDILKRFVRSAASERYSILNDNIRDLNEIVAEDEIIN